MEDIQAKILCNDKISQGYFKMALDAPAIARGARPGQFVQIRCSDCLDPLLRRPFSIHRIPSSVYRTPKAIGILYEVVGKGTELLSKKQAGESVDVLGPLGSGFNLSRNTEYGIRNTILIAGGIGAAPLVFLAEKLMEIQNPKSKIKIDVLIGARTKKLILCEKDFKNIGAEICIATDDGTRGYKGFVSNLFQKILRNTEYGIRTTVYACGPHSMLQRIAEISKAHKMECQVSLEEKMACGIGACLGCAVKVRGKKAYKLACKDGPVFDANQIIWR